MGLSAYINLLFPPFIRTQSTTAIRQQPLSFYWLNRMEFQDVYAVTETFKINDKKLSTTYLRLLIGIFNSLAAIHTHLFNIITYCKV